MTRPQRLVTGGARLGATHLSARARQRQWQGKAGAVMLGGIPDGFIFLVGGERAECRGASRDTHKCRQIRDRHVWFSWGDVNFVAHLVFLGLDRILRNETASCARLSRADAARR